MTECKHPSPDQGALTDDLVERFSVALRAKLCASEAKYGWQNGWCEDGWQDDCRRELLRHVWKGDPLDVAAYAAFCWHHDWSTSASAPAAFRPVEQGDPVAAGGGSGDLAALSAGALPELLKRLRALAQRLWQDSNVETGHSLEARAIWAELSAFDPELFQSVGRERIVAILQQHLELSTQEWEGDPISIEGVERAADALLAIRETAHVSAPTPALRTQCEPVAWLHEYLMDGEWVTILKKDPPLAAAYRRNVRPLYAHPAPAASRPAVGREVTELVDAARELAQYASYSQIVGDIRGNNSLPIREWCDKTFSAVRAVEDIIYADPRDDTRAGGDQAQEGGR